MTLTAPVGDLWRVTERRRSYVRRNTTSGRHSWATPAPTVHPFAVNEARKQLARISAGRLSPALRSQVEDFLLFVCDAQSTVPSIVPTEDGTAVIHWVAGPTSIEIEINENGADYLWAASENGTTQTVSDDPIAIRNVGRRLVAAMATRVNQRNPGWRDQYLER